MWPVLGMKFRNQVFRKNTPDTEAGQQVGRWDVGVGNVCCLLLFPDIFDHSNLQSEKSYILYILLKVDGFQQLKHTVTTFSCHSEVNFW